MTNKLTNCPDCAAKPGDVHAENCDVEHCSVCGGQRLMDDCKGHDPAFARWTGIWPGTAESEHLGIDLNAMAIQGYNDIFFVKPKIVSSNFEATDLGFTIKISDNWQSIIVRIVNKEGLERLEILLKNEGERAKRFLGFLNRIKQTGLYPIKGTIKFDGDNNENS